MAAVDQVGSAGASAGRALALFAALGVVLALLIASALVAGASLLNSQHPLYSFR